MRSKLIVVLLCTLLFCFSVYGQNGAVERLLSTPGLKNAAIGISVKSIKSGESVAEYSSHVSMQPASLIKLFTTGLALEQQGPDYRYKTLVKYSGVIENAVLKGNILIEGSGDPCPDSRFFPDYKLAECLVAWIKDAGIKEIEGSVLITGEEDHSELPGSWVWEDISNYYAAQHFPFNYRDNAYWLEFKTGASGTPAELLSITPPIPQISIINEVLASEKPGDNAWIFGGPYAKNLYVRGYLPQNRKSFKIKGAMHSPATCFVQEVTNKLMAEGIEIKNKPVRELPDKEWNAFESPALKEIVFFTNKQSVNLFSEALAKLSGSSGYESALKSLLTQMGSDTTGIVLKDGCGLSVFSAVPANVFTDYLVWAHQKLGQVFTRSLLLAGTDKGIGAYCRNNTSLYNRLKAKTGSFFGARNLAGYITTSTGEELAFCILINHYDCSTTELQDAVGRFLSDMISF